MSETDDLYIAAPTIDDLMRRALEAIDAHGRHNNPQRGLNRELIGVALELTNPRARLSRTETRGKPFSCLGELCWYLAGTNDEGFITYYIKEYAKSAEGGTLYGGYGPRMFGSGSMRQVDNVIRLLRERPSSRRAVIQLFDAEDITDEHKDVPCTCTLQFMIREDVLHLVTYMRSNDVYLGLPHDVFAFTMLQEIVARDLAVGVGTYKHLVGSLHLYEENIDNAKRFLEEGWQSTEKSMEPMPQGNPWPMIDVVRGAESVIRSTGVFPSHRLEEIDPYWADLIRLLLVLRYFKDKDADRIVQIRENMSSKVYDPFIDAKADALRSGAH